MNENFQIKIGEKEINASRMICVIRDLNIDDATGFLSKEEIAAKKANAVHIPEDRRLENFLMIQGGFDYEEVMDSVTELLGFVVNQVAIHFDDNHARQLKEYLADYLYSYEIE